MTTDAPTTASGEPAPAYHEPSAGPAQARHLRRRRRPSGAAPPLPRKIGFTGTSWLIASAILLVWTVIAINSEWARRVTDQVDSAILRQIVRLRTNWLTDVMDGIDRVGSGWTVTVVAISLLVALMVFRRWRHLFTLLGAILFIQLIGEQLYFGYARARPYDVTIIGRWSGFSFPAAPVAVAAMVLIGITYTLVPAGRARSVAKWIGEAIVLVFAAAELYLGTFHPFDIAVGLSLTVAIMLNGFRFFTPNEVFPVAYRQGKTAHLDVGGQRGAALRQAVQDQLGLKVIEVKPVGLAGSGGSTPLRLTVEGDPNTYLFGKLYAMNHVRADRWYKLGRTLLYGRLEDEAPFQSVQRLVEYEDYGLRLMRDSGILTATPYGIVEMTPAREYLLLTEFFDGAEEIGDAAVDDGIIDEGLLLIRQLWDVGLAHRDIKPANLLVKDGKVLRDRRRVHAAATVTMASGGRPREHDAGPRGTDRRRPRVPACSPVLHRGRDRRGIRRRAGRRQPHAVADRDEEGRPRPAGAVPRARARATPDLVATVEPDPGRPCGPARPHCARRRPAHLEPADARTRARDRRQAVVRYRTTRWS